MGKRKIKRVDQLLGHSNPKGMHPDNFYYNNPPNFGELSAKYPEFKKHTFNTKAGARLDFKDSDAVRSLTQHLLLDHFQLEWTMPADQLCPTVPSRLNYLHWISDLMQISKDCGRLPSGEDGAIHGVDIGTGASCIYPLLGAKVFNWKFLATDIDENSIKHAKENVERNNFGAMIRPVAVEEGSILQAITESEQSYAFTMCNPPFFESMDQTGLSDKTVCTGNSNELVYEGGGEVKFVTQMIDESRRIPHKARWFTSLLGKKSTLPHVRNYLRECKVTNVRSTELCQGRTSRWAVAWSFSDDGYQAMLEEARLALKTGAEKRSKQSSHLVETFELESSGTQSSVVAHVVTALQSEGGTVEVRDDGIYCNLEADKMGRSWNLIGTVKLAGASASCWTVALGGSSENSGDLFRVKAVCERVKETATFLCSL